MYDLISPLIGGLGQLTDPTIWLFVLLGTIIGVIAGATPGIGTTLIYGMVLPFTFVMETTVAIAFLLSISVGVGYGNSIPAILMGIPGTPAAILSVIDGHKLHKRGESGLALAVSLVAAMGGQIISIVLFVLMVVPLMKLAYYFGHPEQFALYLLGIVAIASLTGANVIKGLVAAAFGFLIGIIGIDPNSPLGRFTFGYEILRAGIELAPAVIGLLALSELFRSARQTFQWAPPSGELSGTKFPPWRTLLPVIQPTLVGTVVGTFIGAIPGAGATPAALVSYQQAQLFSKRPEEFGNGSIEGLAANKSAQNASNSGEAAPTFALGIPGSGSMVLLLSALTVHGFVPGPNMIRSRPDLFYAAVAGMFASAIFLCITGWHMAKFMLRLVSINRSMVIIISIALVILGVYSLSGRMFDVYVVLICGTVGYFMNMYGYSTAAAALAVVLGRGLERNLRLGLNLSDGDWLALLSRPITGGFVLVTVVFLSIGIYRTARLKRRMRAEIEAETAAGPTS